jgi:uncharacterized membrane protein YjfL (UPF0719 family)
MNDALSADELLVLAVSVLYAVIKGAAFYRDLFLAARLGRNIRLRLPLALTPLAGLAILLPILLYLAEEDVRTSQLYIFLFLALGAAWMFFASQFFPLLGLSIRVDVVEQGNHPAAVATGGAMLGFLLAYAGGNIGSGPTIWTTIVPALLATACLFLLWFAVELGSMVSVSIAEERDPAAGWRLAGFLVAAGMILGRAIAGDWQSMGATIRDFLHLAWPVLGLALIAIIVERKFRPTLARPAHSTCWHGLLPAFIYLLIATSVVIAMGTWK